MGKKYDTKPRISETPYLSRAGRDHRDEVAGHLSDAIDSLNNVVEHLRKVTGLGAELYIQRLLEEIDKLSSLRRVVNRLD